MSFDLEAVIYSFAHSGSYVAPLKETEASPSQTPTKENSVQVLLKGTDGNIQSHLWSEGPADPEGG